MTPSTERKAWTTPSVERFGSLAEVTRQSGQKFTGIHDQSAHQDDCPRGQFPCDGVS